MNKQPLQQWKRERRLQLCRLYAEGGPPSTATSERKLLAQFDAQVAEEAEIVQAVLENGLDASYSPFTDDDFAVKLRYKAGMGWVFIATEKPIVGSFYSVRRVVIDTLASRELEALRQ